MRLWPISLQDSLIKFWPITTHGSAHIFQSSSSDQSQHMVQLTYFQSSSSDQSQLMVQLTYFQSSCSDQSECMIQLWPIRKHGSAFISWPIRRHGSNSHQHKCLSWSSHQQKYLTFQYKRRASLPSNIPLTHPEALTHQSHFIPLTGRRSHFPHTHHTIKNPPLY